MVGGMLSLFTTSSACFVFHCLSLSFHERRSCWIAWAMAVQPIGVMLALSSISDMPMSAPGRTRWVTSAGHLRVQVLQEATWSHSSLTFRLFSLTGLQGSCVHNYPFTVSVSSYRVGGTTPLLNVYLTFEHMLVLQFPCTPVHACSAACPCPLAVFCSSYTAVVFSSFKNIIYKISIISHKKLSQY